jgi:predicted HAD superfamily phosphohydrolase YqeG
MANRLPFEQLQIPAVACTVLLDVDGTLVPDRGDEPSPEVTAAVARWKELHRVLLCSNSRDRSRVERVAAQLGCGVANRRYRKPSPRVLQEAGSPAGPLLVVGDRALTDGLLAWRTGAAFTQTLPLRSSSDALLPRLAYALDDLATPLLRAVLRWRSI